MLSTYPGYRDAGLESAHEAEIVPQAEALEALPGPSSGQAGSKPLHIETLRRLRALGIRLVAEDTDRLWESDHPVFVCPRCGGAHRHGYEPADCRR